MATSMETIELFESKKAKSTFWGSLSNWKFFIVHDKHVHKQLDKNW